jgi:hypothetical protein
VVVWQREVGGCGGRVPVVRGSCVVRGGRVFRGSCGDGGGDGGGRCCWWSLWTIVGVVLQIYFRLLIILILEMASKVSEKPTKPVTRVWVLGGYLKLHPYPYPPNPYPGTRAGLQTRVMH